MHEISDLFLNWLIVFLPFYIYFSREVHRSNEKRKMNLLFFSIPSVLLCMMFPFSVYKGWFFDLRTIPLMLGTLYGGPVQGAVLLGTVLLYRGIIGGTGFWVTLIAYPPMVGLAMLLSSNYLKKKRRYRFVMPVGLVLVSTTLVAILSYGMRMPGSVGFAEFFITYVSVNALSIFISIYAIEDLSEHAKLKQELIHVEKLQLVGELAASMAHEIRNPLQVTRGFMQLINETVEDEQMKQYVLHAIRELDSAHHVLTEYLSLAKPVTSNREWIDLHDTIADVITLLSSYGHRHGCHIQVAIEDKPRLFVDAQKLKQVLINIGKNAIEAMGNTGTLTFILRTSDKQVSIVIQDTGPGMSVEQINRLGTPFYSTKDNGTGLGLMIAYRITQELGGRIQVSSELGKGSAFEILLPPSGD